MSSSINYNVHLIKLIIASTIYYNVHFIINITRGVETESLLNC